MVALARMTYTFPALGDFKTWFFIVSSDACLASDCLNTGTLVENLPTSPSNYGLMITYLSSRARRVGSFGNGEQEGSFKRTKGPVERTRGMKA